MRRDTVENICVLELSQGWWEDLWEPQRGMPPPSPLHRAGPFLSSPLSSPINSTVSETSQRTGCPEGFWA